MRKCRINGDYARGEIELIQAHTFLFRFFFLDADSASAGDLKVFNAQLRETKTFLRILMTMA